MKNTITNKHGEVVKLGDILFMQSPASAKFPRAFPESSWLFMVKSLNHNRLQGPSVNWKRNGKNNWVSRECDELGSISYCDGLAYGLRRATDEEIAYYFKRLPGYEEWYKKTKIDRGTSR